MRIVARPEERAFLTPLDRQPVRNLVALLYMTTFGLRLRRELRVPGQGDATTVRRELLRRELEGADR